MSGSASVRERARRRAEYVGVRILHAVFRVLPEPLSYRLAELALLTFYRVSRYRERALESLEIAFGDEMSDAERTALFWASVRYQAALFLEFLIGPSLLRNPKLAARVDLTAMEAARTEHERRYPGKGSIIATAHLGAPEVASLLSSSRFWPHTAFARKLDNHLIWDWIVAQRDGFDRPTVHRAGALRPAVRLIRNGGSVALLNDQNAGRDGVFVPYFGRLAATHSGAAGLAVLTGAPIYVVLSIRSRLHRLGARLHVTGPFFADPEGDRDAEVVRLTALITAEIEAMVRRHPEQAFWAHRRWKARPPEEAGAVAAELAGPSPGG